MRTSSQVGFLADQNSAFTSALRMISPSNAAEKATGMGRSLDLILMFRSSRERFTVSL